MTRIASGLTPFGVLAVGILLAGCGDGRPGADRAGEGDVGVGGTEVPRPVDTGAAVLPDTQRVLPGGQESTPGESGPGTSVVKPTPQPPADTAAERRSDTSARDTAARERTQRPQPAPKPEPTPAPTPAPTAARGDTNEDTTEDTTTDTAADTGATDETAAAPAQDWANQYRHVPKDTVSQQVYDGWKQYELNCARCHGEFAMGSTIAPALVVSAKENGSVPTKQAFIQVVCAGRKAKGMPAWCELGLEMDKIEAIYAYVKGRADGKIGVGRPAVRPDA